MTAGSGAELAGEALLDALESGEVRVAEPVGDTWRVNAWVKEAILALFRESPVVALGDFVDKAPLAVRRFAADAGVRLVPGGSAVRRGAHIGRGCVLMPPCYVNIGAFVDAGTMIDSHALVGSCAQIGRDVHVSAAAQVGGVLEPVGSRPVIVEDGALLGGGVGLYEGVRVGRRAVIAAGVVLTASTPVYDLSREQVLRGTADAPLEIPPDAVVVPGARPTSSVWGASQGVSLACAVIAKYRDGDTDAATALESALR